LTLNAMLLLSLGLSAVTWAALGVMALIRQNGRTWMWFRWMTVVSALSAGSGFFVAYQRGGWDTLTFPLVFTIVTRLGSALLNAALAFALWRESKEGK
jgi:hypothetical protein